MCFRDGGPGLGVEGSPVCVQHINLACSSSRRQACACCSRCLCNLEVKLSVFHNVYSQMSCGLCRCPPGGTNSPLDTFLFMWPSPCRGWGMHACVFIKDPLHRFCSHQCDTLEGNDKHFHVLLSFYGLKLAKQASPFISQIPTLNTEERKSTRAESCLLSLLNNPRNCTNKSPGTAV